MTAGGHACTTHASADSQRVLAELVQSLVEHAGLLSASVHDVAEGCARVASALRAAGPIDPALLAPLFSLLESRAGPRLEPLGDLLLALCAAQSAPWPILERMLSAQDHALGRRALELAAQLGDRGRVTLEPDEVARLAERVEDESGPFGERAMLELVARLIRVAAGDPQAADDRLHGMLQPPHGPRLRRLAARILDLADEPAPAAVCEQLLGAEGHAVLRDYLAYTRASHLDLVHLGPEPGALPPVVPSFRAAERQLGAAQLREVVAEVGWLRLCVGIEVRPEVGISVSGSIPLVLSPPEAALFDGCDGVRRTGEWTLLLLHGGAGAGTASAPSGQHAGTVERFRVLNLTHAALLEDILDVAPLSRGKVERILGRMDAVVQDFVALFHDHSRECDILPELYRTLKERVLGELAREVQAPQLSAELTRLVQTFEDPASLGEVRTLHGLKRYLHQRGLRLGFRLVRSEQTPSCTVDLVVLSRGERRLVQRIRYADFEPGHSPTVTAARLPFPVAIVAEGFARQAVHGHTSYPHVDVYCYGNEVHYYLAFRNHPAFLRIDFSPPLRGGMVDLEYFGVSNYELDRHPDLSLGAIRAFLRRLEFGVEIEGVRIHARCDKESLCDLGELCDHAAALFRLVPYLMDIDWTVGALDLEADARATVVEAWAESFRLWGVLPLAQLLTADRRNVLAGVARLPRGVEQEVPWRGRGPYHDRFHARPPARFLARVQELSEQLGLEGLLLLHEDSERPMGQIRLERSLLGPLREAEARGEIEHTPAGYRRRDPQLYQRDHEAVVFAQLVGASERHIADAVATGRIAALLERITTFRTTGSVAGREVQRARVGLLGDSLGLFVLRGPDGFIRLGSFASGEVPFLRRADPEEPWRSNCMSDPRELTRLLRANNFPSLGVDPSAADVLAEALALRRELCAGPLPREPGPQPGERVVTGLRASEGRVTGRAVFGTAGRKPEDLDGTILVTPTLGPEDIPFLYRAAGVVSTSGGVLSHAGLIATQFHKPALVIEGRWHVQQDGSTTLLLVVPEYSEEDLDVAGLGVTLRLGLRDREVRMCEGDLLVLNASASRLRVLGQDRDTLALADELFQLGRAGRALMLASSDHDILTLRGERVRARHQLERLLSRIEDPVLARHAIRELLLGDALAGDGARPTDRATLVRALLGNRHVGAIARAFSRQTSRELARRAEVALRAALERIPSASSEVEVVMLRLEALRLDQSLGAVPILPNGDSGDPPTTGIDPRELDAVAATRLEQLFAQHLGQAEALARHAADGPDLRYRLRRAERLAPVLGAAAAAHPALQQLHAALEQADEAARRACADRSVLEPHEVSAALAPLVGWKAANLAEVERLGASAGVPPWFVVTDHAFRRVLEAPLARPVSAGAGAAAEPRSRPAVLGAAIRALEQRPDLGFVEKSAAIRALWDEVQLPDELARAVGEAYRRLAAAPSGESASTRAGAEAAAPLVALRSSACEEDSEQAARAGEFDTFLFVRGLSSVLDHLKRTWSGLWTERALHNRAVLGVEASAGGGVLVQRMVAARVAGVLLTVNVPHGELREMVINVGLGLGEGVVSGRVAADHVTVSKHGDLTREALRFRYVTADKRQQVVFDRRTGTGTVLDDTLYHQRLRPALEYVELVELVRVAAELEAAFGLPLDIEFAFDGPQLCILQARPVAPLLAALRETAERFPLRPREGCP